MNASMADYLRVVTPYLHPELASAEAMSHIQKLAQTLPTFSKAMLEFRLGEGHSQGDLSVFSPCCIPNLPKTFLTHSSWQTLQDFCREWVEPTSFLHQCVEYIGLEFDLDEPPSQMQIPCIFVSWHRDTIIDAQTLIEIVRRLSNKAISEKLKLKLRLCVDALPDSANIAFLGVMLSRPNQAVRVIVSGIPLPQFSDYLLQIGWSEPTNQLSNLESTLSDFADEFRLLSFDVGDTIYPRIGLEFLSEKQPKDESQWQLFLNHLVKTGLCTPAKQEALLAWPGASQKADQLELWPPNLAGGDFLLGSKALSVFWRKINHIKIVYQPGNALEAKAYLLFSHDWFDVNALVRKELLKT